MSSAWHAIIVDDERLARRELRTLLAAHPAIEIVAEADSVAGAEERIRLTGANLVFLDVHLANGESGLDLLPKLVADVTVILVTAFDRYAVHAFDAEATDFLLKPVAPMRLARALARLPVVPTRTGNDGASASPPHTEDHGGRLGLSDRLFIRMDERMGFLSVSHIRAVLADRDDSRVLLTNGRTVTVRKSLAEWEARLPTEFLRIHRSTIVQLACVERLDEWSHGSYHVWLRGVHEPFVMSRRFATRVRARLG